MVGLKIFNLITKNKRNSVFVFCAELLLVAFLIIYYSFGFFYSKELSNETKLFLVSVGSGYLILLIPWFISGNRNTNFHAYELFSVLLKIILRCSSGKFTLSKPNRNLVLFFIVRAIFIPIMVNYAIDYMRQFYSFFHMKEINSDWLWLQFGWYKIALVVIFLIDTVIFSTGYLIESSFLKNKVKSVDFTLLGWIVVLACYRPFNFATNAVFPFPVNDFVELGSKSLTNFIYMLTVAFHIVYLSATLSLGFKSCNLSNRGICKSGAYKIIRHPAYSGKVLAWWVLAIPVINLKICICLMAWTFIYIIRAITEEIHLMNDSDYQNYMSVTKYRFIPGLI